MNLKRLSVILISALIILSCKTTERPHPNIYSLGAFYNNNHLTARDSANRFHNNCTLLFILKQDSIEIYRGYAGNKFNDEQTYRFKLTISQRERFISIVQKQVNLKESKTPTLYCGASYVASVENFDVAKYGTAIKGIGREDDLFISHLLEITKSKKKIKPSKKLIKERYFMLGLIHQTMEYIRESKVMSKFSADK